MNYIELSRKDVKKETKRLYDLITKEYEYDLVIFIAKGAFEIGIELGNLNQVPVLEVMAKRKGNKAKQCVKNFLKFLPKSIDKYLREKELKSNIHTKNSDRYISFNEKIFEKYKFCKKILIVDDSVDTGYTILQVRNTIHSFFNNCNIKIASFNYFKKALEEAKPDFYLFEDQIIKGPWSNDSKEYNIMLKNYYEWKNSLEGEL